MFFSHVIILGDLNTAHRPIDHCDAGSLVRLPLNPTPHSGSGYPAGQYWKVGTGGHFLYGKIVLGLNIFFFILKLHVIIVRIYGV